MAKVITLGEMLLRLSTETGQRLRKAYNLEVNYGGAEVNVAIALSLYGHDTRFVTRLPDNLLTDGMLNYLESYKVNTSYICFGGERIGSYFVEVGAGNRSSKVVYDRKHSSMSEWDKSEIDFSAFLKGQDVLHISGITPALSKSAAELTIKLVKEAKSHGLFVSFDCNFREKLWTIEDARKTFKRILPYVDICSCGELDLKYIFNYDVDAELSDALQLGNLYEQLLGDFPNIVALYSTKRNQISSSHNTLTGYYYINNKLYMSNEVNIDHIIDRVGGGDAFSSSVLHGYLSKWEAQNIVEFATTAAALKHTIKGDANLVTENEVMDLMANGTKISR